MERGGIARVNLVGSRRLVRFKVNSASQFLGPSIYIYILDDMGLDITFTLGPESNTYQLVHSNVRLSLDMLDREAASPQISCANYGIVSRCTDTTAV